MTTGGEGGMVNTNNSVLWSRMWSYKDHGKDFEQATQSDRSHAFRWVHESFGSNYRMLELQAVIGRIQLGRMAEWHRRRILNAKSIIDVLRDFSPAVRVPQPRPGFEHAYYRLYAYVQGEQLRPGWTRDRIIAELQNLEVPAFHGSCSEVYREKAFDSTPFRPSQRLPVALELGETSIAFAVHPTLTDEDISRVRSGINKIFKQAADLPERTKNGSAARLSS